MVPLPGLAPKAPRNNVLKAIQYVLTTLSPACYSYYRLLDYSEAQPYKRARELWTV